MQVTGNTAPTETHAQACKADVLFETFRGWTDADIEMAVKAALAGRQARQQAKEGRKAGPRIAALAAAKVALDATKDLLPDVIREMRKFPDLRNMVYILGRAEMAIYNAYSPITKRLYEQDEPPALRQP